MDFCGIEKLSLLDYDNNISCTLFMAGCSFRCPFCHNGSLVLSPNDNSLIPWQEIKDYLKKRVGILEAVCITGGEPTLMPDLFDKIKEIKDLGFKVKLDSNGSNPNVLRKLIDNNLVDYIAMDIKNSKEKYAQTIGLKEFDISRVEESVKLLQSSGIDYEFRTTLIEEFHSKDDILSIAKWIKDSKHYFLQKYIDREGCIEHGFHEVKKEIALNYLDVLKEYIPNVSLRGY